MGLCGLQLSGVMNSNFSKAVPVMLHDEKDSTQIWSIRKTIFRECVVLAKEKQHRWFAQINPVARLKGRYWVILQNQLCSLTVFLMFNATSCFFVCVKATMVHRHCLCFYHTLQSLVENVVCFRRSHSKARTYRGDNSN